ncbi:MAG TPA: multicopper oxidase domain-containing protein [Candidatus Eremiobacteraceae bacterium]|nr:multicopper oxidase domain-containing protein [Candidatus Eremiobacteraceae bacterium]
MNRSSIGALLSTVALAYLTACSGRSASADAPADVRVPAVTAEVSTTEPGYAVPTPQSNPESLPPLPSGNTVTVNLVLLDRTVQIAPGVKYRAWTFNGTVPGPVIHAQVGDTIDVTLTNKAMMGHSIDFHAALAPPNIAYQTVQPGKTLHFSWVARYPGAFLYHCGTPPVLAHISNGMYGAVIVDPKDGWGSDARSFVLVQSEFYPSPYPGAPGIFYGDLSKMKTAMADVVTFNGLAFRYRVNPLQIKVGQPVRVFVVDAGPSHFSAFHIVGTILSRVLVDGNPSNQLEGIQTTAIPPGGGAVVEFTVQQAGTYPVVTHSFGDADAGALGLFNATD